MEIQTATEEITFSLRIPVELNEKIIAAALKERRSRQAQIIIALEGIYNQKETPIGNGKKEKTK